MKHLYIILLILPLIVFGQGNIGYTSTVDGTLFKTTDSGETWTLVYDDFDYVVYGGMSFVNETNISTIEPLTPTSKRELIKTTNILGQENTTIKNQPMIEIYNDGSVEKKYIIE